MKKKDINCKNNNLRIRKISIFIVALFEISFIHSQIKTTVITNEDKMKYKYALHLYSFKYTAWNEDQLNLDKSYFYFDLVNKNGVTQNLLKFYECPGLIFSPEYIMCKKEDDNQQKFYSTPKDLGYYLYEEDILSHIHIYGRLWDNCESCTDKESKVAAHIDGTHNISLKCSSDYMAESNTSKDGDAKMGYELDFRYLPLHFINSDTLNISNSVVSLNSVLPTNTKINIFDKSGFDFDQYLFQYKLTENNKWIDVPNNLYNLNKLSVSAKDLFGSESAQLINKNVDFRVVSCYEYIKLFGLVLFNDYRSTSNILTLTIKPSPPHISSSMVSSPRCTDTNDGKLSVVFDRALQSNEVLHYNIQSENSPLIDGDPVSENDFGTDNSFTFPHNLSPGTYDLKYFTSMPYTNAQGVTTTINSSMTIKSFTVTAPDSVQFISSKADASCFGSNNGTITLAASGGVGKYEYCITTDENQDETWLPFSQNDTHTIESLVAGKYYLQVRDTNICYAKLPLGGGIEKRLITITEPTSAVTVDLVNLTHPKAYGYADGTIEVEVSGGTPKADGSYDFNWTRNDETALQGSTTTRKTTEGYRIALTGAVDGKYILTVKDALQATDPDAEGCFYTDTFTLEQPQPLRVTLQVTDSVSCFGENTAAVVAHARGGVALNDDLPYQYVWKKENGSGIPEIIPETTDSIVTNMAAGRYALNIIDANGISLAQDSVIIIQQPALLQFSPTKTDIICHGAEDGTLTFSVVGGSGGYEYLLQPELQPAANWESMSDNLTINNLKPDTYTLQVRDKNLCQATTSGNTPAAVYTFTISQPEEKLKITTTKLSNPLASGNTDGRIETLISGGTPKQDGTYNFLWTKYDGSAVSGAATGEVSASGYKVALNDVAEGKYILTITDARYADDATTHYCMVADTFELKQPLPLTVDIEITDTITCHGDINGSLTAHARGGVVISDKNPYSYFWKKQNEAGGFDILPAQTDSVARNLSAGRYALNITDANGISLQIDSVFTLEEPAPVRLTVLKQDVACYDGNNGWIKFSATGGTGKYLYRFSAGDTPDADWTAWPADDMVSYANLSSGSYTIELKDTKGCNARVADTEAPDIRTVIISQPDKALSITKQKEINPLAYGYSDGLVEALISGGTPHADGGYSFGWFRLDGSEITSNTSATVNSDGYLVRLAAIPDGRYILKVTDANHPTDPDADGCVATDTFTVVQPAPLKVRLEVRDSIRCHGDISGSLIAYATGGIKHKTALPYTYQWKKESTSGSFVPMADKSDSIITDLSAGRYTLNITDANGISLTEDTVRVITQPDILQLSINQTNISCSGIPDGTATALVAGGTPPYRYEWSNSANTPSINNLETGIYMLIVQDKHGCEIRQQVNIIQPDGMTLTFEKQDPLCHNDCNGSLKAIVTGGRAPYSYRWTGSASTSQIASELCPGTYSVVVTDASGCSISKTENLKNPELPALNVGGDRFLCNGQSIDYDISLFGQDNISYEWTSDNGFSSDKPKVTLSKTGRYTATITDSRGCSNTSSFYLKSSDVVIENNFAMPTQAFTDEPIVVVNTTYPTPDSIRWILPESSAIKAKNEAYAEFAVADTGVYVIKLITFRGNCFAEQSKKLIVTQRSEFNDSGIQLSPFILAFGVSPNPNRGNFAAHITLKEVAPAILKLISIGNNRVVNTQNLSGSDTYTVPVNLSLPAGVYLLLLETPKGSASVKVIIM